MLVGMAGGMSRPRPTVPVPVAVRGRSRSAPDLPGAPDTGPDVGPGRHCWVADPADDTTARRAGLLVEWRRAVGGGWEGRVVRVAQVRPGRWALVEEWVDESLLGPV
jgi:hypothetical protein